MGVNCLEPGAMDRVGCPCSPPEDTSVCHWGQADFKQEPWGAHL